MRKLLIIFMISFCSCATIRHTHDYVDITNKPDEIELSKAILQVMLFDIKTQPEIATLKPVRGVVIINSTDNVLQWYDGTKWCVFITAN